MSILTEIKNQVKGKQLDMFKAQLKRMSSDQIMQMLVMASQKTAKDVLNKLDHGISVEQIKKDYELEV